MARPSTQIAAVGFFVMAALALFLMMLLAIGSGKWFSNNVSYRIFLDSSVKGLAEGAQVKFRGVKVGQVTSISLEGGRMNDEDANATVQGKPAFPITITMELIPESFGFKESWLISLFTKRDSNAEATEELIQKLVLEKGLEVQMKMLSLLTGQKYLEMNVSHTPMEPEVARRRAELLKKHILPAKRTSLDMLAEELERKDFSKHLNSAYKLLDEFDRFVESGEARRMLERIETITAHIDEAAAKLPTLVDEGQRAVANASQLTAEAGATVEKINDATDGARKLVEDIDHLVCSNTENATALIAELRSAATKTNDQLDITRQLLVQLRNDTAQDSPLRQRIDALLDECTQAASRASTLMEMLSRDPQMMLMGR